MLAPIQGKISVLIPCFNEAGSIRENLREISAFFAEFSESYEVICVDDGSQDGTLAKLKAVAERDPHIRVLHYRQNEGKGFALRCAFQAADGDYVVFLDADLDLHPRVLGKFFQLMQEQDADVVIGSKRHPESRVSYPLRRRLISKTYHFILWLLFGLPLRDTQVGLKVFRRRVLEEVFYKILCKRFALDVELLANIHRLNYKIIEAPIELEFRRTVRWGRVTYDTLWSTLLDTLAIFYRMHILKYYDLKFLREGSYPTVSVIVPYDRYSPEVEETLRGCLDIQFGSFTVIACGTDPPRLESDRILYVPLDARRASLLEIIEGLPTEALAFVRPGAVPDRFWLEKASRNLGSADIVAVSGPILPQAGDFWSEAVREVLSSLMGCGGFRYRYMQSLHRYVNTITLENLIMKKEDLVSALRRNRLDTGVETWLGHYIQKGRKRVVYDPEVVVHRRFAPLFVPYFSTIFTWGHTRGQYIRLNPASLFRWPETVFVLPALLVLFLAVGLPMALLSPLFAKVFLAAIAVYLVLVALESFSSLRPGMILAIGSGIVSTHIAYGVGCWMALLLNQRSGIKPVAVELKH
ncbi:MAG: glycosyltransferase [Acidobacteria bacterium]|nr:glycosyltransferase [Acidobacteriota bacterium]